MDKKFIPNARQKQVLSIINERDYCSTKELSNAINASEATIRRDLDNLADCQYIGRVHGGAVKIQQKTTFEPFHADKIKLMVNEKKRIAKCASTLIHDGNSVFLDSGTTTLFIAEELKTKKNLTIITDNLDIVSSVQFDNTTNVILTGGLLRQAYSVVVGDITEDIIKRFKVDIAFTACDAVDPEVGLFNANYLEIGVKKAITKCGTKTVLVADSSKFKNYALAYVCSINEIDCIISDTGLSEACQSILKKRNIELHLV